MERQKSRKKWFDAGRYLAALGLCGCLFLTGCRAGDAARQENDEGGTPTRETTEAVVTRENNSTEENSSTEGEKASEETVRASFVPSDKDEMVSVQAEADGTPKKIEVSGTLSGFRQEDGAYVQDGSKLTELKNATGEEEFAVADDGTVYWQNLGGDIHYEGICDAELPVDVHVTYYLDGEELPLTEMKGKSGSVKIRFDYEIHETAPVEVRGETQEMTLPFLALSMVALPEDTFSDVEVSHGQILMLGGQKAAIGYALPGLQEDLNLTAHEDTADIELPSNVEITAEAKDFELDFTATVLKPGLFRDMDEEKLDSMEEKTGDVDEMEDAVKEMEDAAQKLVDGTTELQDYLVQYANGVNQVMAAVATLNQSLASYDLSSLGQLSDSLQQVAALSQMGNSLQQIAQLSQLADPLRQLGGLAEPLAQTAQLSDLAAQLEAAAAANPGSSELQALAAWADPLRAYASLSASAEGVQSIAQYADSVAALSTLADSTSGLSQLSALADAATQITQLQSGLQELQNGVAQLAQGTASLPAAGQALYDGTDELKNGMTEFRDGIKEFREEGVQELTSFFREDLGDLIARLRGVHMADLQYTGYTPSLAGQEVNVSFLIETDGTK